MWNTRAFFFALVLAVVGVGMLQDATIGQRLETFDRDPGWSGSGNRDGGNDYGYLSGPSRYAGGTHPGELGGTLSRTGSFTYHADTHLRGTFDTSGMLKMSGRIAVTTPIGDPGSDRNILGYFDTGSQWPVMLGIRICDPKNSRADWRIRLCSINSSGNVQGSDASIGVEMTVDGDYHFEWTYDPSEGMNGRLTLRITTNTGSIWVGDSDITESQDETIALNLAAGHGTADPAARFDAFGLGVMSAASNGFTADIYLDDLLYTVFRDRAKASNPIPSDRALFEAIEAVLAWTPGDFAVQHDVYLGTTFETVNSASRVNPMGVLLSQGQTGTTFDPLDALDFSRTYYWRIDEVNGAPDFAIVKGNIWSFTTEPFAYPITNIIATTNGISDPDSGPERTVDGSGLDADDQHSVAASDMWLADPPIDEILYIQYEFNRVYKLLEMLVWNYNVQFELVLGFGLKDVTIEYSSDGEDWIVLADAQFAQATARADYAANTLVDLRGVAARFVRLNVRSGWGVAGQFGLSEVRFMYVPTHAHEPRPADGAVDIDPDVLLGWRTGRDAISHDVYFGINANELLPVGSAEGTTFTPDAVEFGATYYWRIDAVSDDVWAGDLWSFTTREYRLIDGFESYTDDIDAGEAIFDTWLDGWVNSTGSTVGYLEAPFAEHSIVHSGVQSMPLHYDNTVSPFYSEAERRFEVPQDLTVGGANGLSLHFRGSAANSPQTLYIVLEDNTGHTATVRSEEPEAVLATEWQQWVIPYSDLAGVNLSRVTTMYIGIGNRTNPTAGGTGVIYVDDVAFGRPATE